MIGSAKNCKEKGCMGKPKKTSPLNLEGFIGNKCDTCFKTVNYEKVETNSKSVSTSEEELAKLEQAASGKKVEKRKKDTDTTQGSLF